MPNPLDRIDRWQRRHRLIAFPVAVGKKFDDDNAGSLAALLSYYAFVATFPLLVVLVNAVEIALRGHPRLQERILDSALTEFPVIGQQLRDQADTHLGGSSVTLLFALLIAVIGARGVAATFQRVCNQLWGVAYVDRPSIGRAILRTVTILLLLGVGAVSGAGVATFVSIISFGPLARTTSLALTFVITAALFIAIFRLATAGQVATRDLLRGAIASAVVWQALLAIGTLLVAHQLRYATTLYGVFGAVLGLLAWFVIQATATLLAIESDVVRSKRLWPRGLRQPLTAADQLALEGFAQGQRRDVRQAIHVRFEPHPHSLDD